MALLLIALMAGSLASAEPPSSGDCGWLVASGDWLVDQPDPALKPLDPGPLPTPPREAKAAYCVRATQLSDLGDERILKLGLPLVIRSGGHEGYLELDPAVTFNYHKVGNRYAPGRFSERGMGTIWARTH
jgi:hypothetical protein